MTPQKPIARPAIRSAPMRSLDAEQRRDEDDSERHRRDQDAGERRADPLLAHRDQRKRYDQLRDRECGDRRLVRERLLQRAASPRDRHEHDGRQRDPPPCDAHGRQILQSQLDEEVRQTPDRAQGRERRPCAPRHRRGTLSQELCGSTAIESCDVARPHGGVVRHENLTLCPLCGAVCPAHSLFGRFGGRPAAAVECAVAIEPSQSNMVPTRAPGGSRGAPGFHGARRAIRQGSGERRSHPAAATDRRARRADRGRSVARFLPALRTASAAGRRSRARHAGARCGLGLHREQRRLHPDECTRRRRGRRSHRAADRPARIPGEGHRLRSAQRRGSDQDRGEGSADRAHGRSVAAAAGRVGPGDRLAVRPGQQRNSRHRERHCARRRRPRNLRAVHPDRRRGESRATPAARCSTCAAK